MSDTYVPPGLHATVGEESPAVPPPNAHATVGEESLIVGGRPDPALIRLPFDQIIPTGGAPRTVDIIANDVDVGNATMRYVTNGVLCTVDYEITTFPSASDPWELPLPALIDHTQILNVAAWDVSASHFRTGAATLDSTSHRVSRILIDDFTSGNPRVRAGYPWAWASGDWLRVYGTYMCRSIVST